MFLKNDVLRSYLHVNLVIYELTLSNAKYPADSTAQKSLLMLITGNRPSIAKLLDLEMLVTTGGRERTQAEFKILLESSGFKLSRIIDTKESICVIEGVRL